jgi:hypothetical protein
VREEIRSGLKLNANEAIRISIDDHPSGTGEPVEAVLEVVWRDTELPGKVVERASKHVVTGDDFEDARLNEKSC